MRCVGGVRKSETPELISQIKNFMDKDRRVSVETIGAQFDVSVGTVHTIIREELKMRSKRWGNNNKDEDNSLEKLNDKNQQASS